MITRTGAVDVLLEAMRRPGALGIIFSRKRLHEVLKSLAGRGEVDLMESVFEAMPAAGLPPDRNTVYILVRAYVNTGQVDKAAALAARYKEMGLEVKPTGERLLELATIGRCSSSSSSSTSSQVQGDGGGGQTHEGEAAGAGNKQTSNMQGGATGRGQG